MPRQMRIQYPGAIYHVSSRGDRREAVFRNTADCHDFIKTLAEACQKTRFQIHAYCLMKNHFHLVVETPEGNLVAGMRWLLSTYSNRFNRRHNLYGPVFSGRYKALIVDGGARGCLRTACDYTHLTPVRAKLLRPKSRLLKYPWSSFGQYLKPPKHRPKWLRVDRLLREHGIAKDTAAGRRQFERRMETRRAEAGDPGQWTGMRRGWYLGPPRFHQALLKRLQRQLGASHSGKRRRQANRAHAEAIIAQELRRLRWKEADLRRRAKTDARKLALAARVRRETTMTIGEIAQRLHMGARNTLNAKLHQWKTAHERKG